MIGTITLNPSIDQHILVRGLLKDDANRAEEIYRYPGGKGINVSKVIRELGGKTQAWALLGGPPGELLKEGVRELDIPFFAHPVPGNTRINTILTDLKDRTQTRVSAPGPLISKRILREFLKRLLAARPKPAYWVLGGSLSRGMADDTYRAFILALEKNGSHCVLDTDNKPLEIGIEATPYMIKPNEYEMQRLVKRPLASVEDYLAAARSVVRRGVEVVIVSLGKRGALFVTSKEAFHLITPKVPVKSKVGAGDSLIGGAVLGLSRGLGLREAARLGVAASTSAVMREAPRLCRRSDIRPLLGRIRIRELR